MANAVRENASCWRTISAATFKNAAAKRRIYLARIAAVAPGSSARSISAAKTILKVAAEIVRQQDAFFAHGVRHLRPLNLKTVADAISMHESTVSRVTANKYMATNRGIFELKYFFTSSIASSDGGEAHSAEAVRDHIKQLIEAENPARFSLTTRSWKNCARPALISRDGRSRNTARPCVSRLRSNAAATTRRRRCSALISRPCGS